MQHQRPAIRGYEVAELFRAIATFGQAMAGLTAPHMPEVSKDLAARATKILTRLDEFDKQYWNTVQQN